MTSRRGTPETDSDGKNKLQRQSHAKKLNKRQKKIQNIAISGK
jgi:hypothetical protein